MSIDQVKQFHAAFKLPIRDTPKVGSADERELRVRLMLEEVLEFARAAGVCLFSESGDEIAGVSQLEVCAAGAPGDLVAMAHELADVRYVVDGTAVQLGIPLDAVTDEVHAANMRKLGGPVRADGKVMKPEGWRPADVAAVLRRSGR